jgi:2-oxoglutarate dehydrogenase E1 component
MARSSIDEMGENTIFQRLIPEVLHPNPLVAKTEYVDFEQYSGNNIEPRLPYSLTKDATFELEAPNKIKTVIFCSGQVYYLLYKTRALNKRKDVAIVRLEQLNPFPFIEVQQVIDLYQESLEEIVYCQEESFNSGAWSFVEPRLETAIRDSAWYNQVKDGQTKGRLWQDKLDEMRCAGGLENARSKLHKTSVRGSRLVRYAGRDISAAPATGIKKQHKFEEKMLLSEALFQGALHYPPKRMEQDVPIFIE